MSKWEQKLEEIMQRGGFGFWVLCLVSAVGFYGILWLMMALGVSAGF